MTADGTVAGRKFIDFPAEKDHLWHVLYRIRKKQREHGPKSTAGFWAYDGTGKLERDKTNHSLAVFQSGKIYNCDPSACYNIGARYFIREIRKSIPETEWSVLAAKVPGVQRRTSSVYADLLSLKGEMRSV